MYIRQLVTGTFRTVKLTPKLSPLTTTRSIYLHKGPRVAGLKRDPQEALVNSQGLKYELTDDNIKHIKTYLGDKYSIPDDIVLQVLTHKSFGNGIKPYNEKLAAMGSKLLSFYLAKHVTKSANKDSFAINGRNLDVLGSPISRELGGLFTLGVFAKQQGLNQVMFWTTRNANLGFESSGELRISAQMMYALIGAVNFYHGKEVAELFIQERLIDQLEKITVDLVSGKAE
ncbi:uncharacterized protein SPAPADRAFT_61561 [Spathaspora passalidarum NRRL Y-27907]|uniref:RNase III domain-containing protein n=1 Tax=Spathaspora passalidarum (strain NRRL Y-27907 / 11-Y1) TaxID=619300 RepID=G3ANB3_SPAPN|nr:uncharacterized protein SPAPADRAFT_61561 [Spathaspora passalidarum NRRL Y-27907]EGW32496.1 hypothetical protein SPAPADRAFT_61561 [Spathaspora passalidarum NRRL Y-27907]